MELIIMALHLANNTCSMIHVRWNSVSFWPDVPEGETLSNRIDYHGPPPCELKYAGEERGDDWSSRMTPVHRVFQSFSISSYLTWSIWCHEIDLYVKAVEIIHGVVFTKLRTRMEFCSLTGGSALFQQPAPMKTKSSKNNNYQTRK